MYMKSSIVLLAAAASHVLAATKTGEYLPQVSPVFPKMKAPTGVVSSYNPGPYDTTSKLSSETLKGYPEPWSSPDTNHPEIKAAYKRINWSKVPKAPVRKQNSDGEWVSDTDGSDDPYCWWSDTNCVTPKVSYLPPDIYECPKGDWGLTYDDGPFNRLDHDDDNYSKENPYAEPALYNYLAKRNLHANLFYIGSNVVTYPAAAKRALNNGHQLCIHTWSHPVMTTQSNIQVVAQFYWALKAVKEATGVTSQCWRPPQGDVDDRIRSIAWQMGMRTILWNEDTNDWNMVDPMNGGDLKPKVVDGYFRNWINSEKQGKFKHGLVVLEHELNRMTVNMSMHWLPELEKNFNIVPATSCNGITQPYWEKNFVYPSTGSKDQPSTTTTTESSKPTSGTSCTAGSFGLNKGDGYNGYCCQTQADCWDDCIEGKCNGPVSTKTTTIAPKPTSGTSCTDGSFSLGKGDGYNGYCCESQADCLDDCIKGSCNGPKKSSVTCTAGSRGKRKGDGADGFCCSSSDDCQETCRQGICGL